MQESKLNITLKKMWFLLEMFDEDDWEEEHRKFFQDNLDTIRKYYENNAERWGQIQQKWIDGGVKAIIGA